MTQPTLTRHDNRWVGRFDAMACDCEVLVESDDKALALRITDIVAAEAHRIEKKYSRYRTDSIIHRINQHEPVDVDEETAHLLDFASRCYEFSDSRFDITSGILRRVWRFDGGSGLPTPADVEALLPAIGWSRVQWRRPRIALPSGMEIDLGGIGKEYAVDRAALLVSKEVNVGVVANFGGDLVVTGPRPDNKPWRVGIEHPDDGPQAVGVVDVRRGAMATSGDAKRFVEKDGVRYSHVLDPRTGWPVPKSPRSVTVLAGTCSEAGFLSTMALLEGAQAESFLDAQGVRHWCVR